MGHKVHITLSIDQELYEKIKRHPEIKWSEAARTGIKRQLEEVEGVIKGSDLFKELPEETKTGIEEISKLSKADWKNYYKKMKEKEWKRTKSLTPVY